MCEKGGSLFKQTTAPTLPSNRHPHMCPDDRHADPASSRTSHPPREASCDVNKYTNQVAAFSGHLPVAARPGRWGSTE